jgi:hypothetical protein
MNTIGMNQKMGEQSIVLLLVLHPVGAVEQLFKKG